MRFNVEILCLEQFGFGDLIDYGQFGVPERPGSKRQYKQAEMGREL